MKLIVALLLLSSVLLFIFACSEDEPIRPPSQEDPRNYYPLGKNYGWRYFEQGLGVPADSFDLKILGTNTRHDNLGFDLQEVGVEDDTLFIYQDGDTLFEEVVPLSHLALKVLVGPVKTGTFWRDGNFEYLITGFENVTLNINDVTYRDCAKILKTYRNPAKTNRIYEWWAPQYGEVKELEVDTLDVSQYLKELIHFSRTGEFP